MTADEGSSDLGEVDTGDSQATGDLGTDEADPVDMGSTRLCESNIWLLFDDGSNTQFDGCVDWSIDATFEFDPDDIPEIRHPVITFRSTTEAAFECSITLELSEACGLGYYCLEETTAGQISFDIHDCPGVPDSFEVASINTAGYVHMTGLFAGDTPGNFTGEPLYSLIEGNFGISSTEGVTINGNFSVADEIIAVDAEEAGCSVSDGDDDNDAYMAACFGGPDCLDSDETVNPNGVEYVSEDPSGACGNCLDGLDNDCDGVTDWDDPDCYENCSP
jgi:hypothetical protein